MEIKILALSFLGALTALVFAGIKAKKVLGFSQGTDTMKKIATFIKEGANAYLTRQYKIVSIFFACMFVLLFVLSRLGFLNKFIPFAFVTGGFYSALAGFFGMKIATSANSRTANACGENLNKGLNVAFSAGSVMGFTVVGLGLLDVSLWYAILKFGFNCDVVTTATTIVMFGMGASSMALFARVGGGVFTKAADVGADIVGKVEAGIPEDDPRNPAVIADNVGDNVGDVAGMGADLYESYFGSIVSACALGVAAFKSEAAMGVPLLLAVLGIVASLIGTFFVKTGEKFDQKLLLKALSKGTTVSSIIVALGAFPIVWFVLGKENINLYIAVLSGLLTGVLIGQATEYFTSDTYKPTKKLAGASETGSATIIISGMSLGMLSTALPIVIIAICILVAFFTAGGGATGLYGIGLAAVGMLSTLGITLATDAYGPIADNAGGNAQMSELEPEVRQRTDVLDALGNTTAATGKGFAIGSAALTGLALLASYIEEIKIGLEHLGKEVVNVAGETIAAAEATIPDIMAMYHVDLMNPVVLVGIFIGAMMAFLFCGLTMNAVGRAAQSMVTEVRRQFREIKGILTREATPDYARCVEISTKGAQREMLLPSIVAIVVPILVGLILGPAGVMGLLIGGLGSGFVLAVFMSNSGGAWDNAKKYVEEGHFGGKNSEAHKATVTGDTVGDPFKDTSGPSLNILIKLMSMVSIVMAMLTVAIH